MLPAAAPFAARIAWRRLAVLVAAAGVWAALGVSPAWAGAPDDAPGAADGTTAPADPATTDAEADKPKSRGLSRETAEQGEQELFKSVRVFQQRYVLKAGRAELQLGGGITFNDPFVRHTAATGSLLYHINEQWAVGAGGGKFWGVRSSLFNAMQDDYGLFPERSEMQAGGFGEVSWSPIFGKFSSFGLAVLQADAYVLAGGGAMRTTRGTDLKPAFELGAGMRVHTLRWLTLSFEVRDVAVMEKFLPQKPTELASTRIMQHVFADIRLGFWLPPTVQYRYPR